MVQVPTNYRMGTGLAATILGQQAGLEAEQQGLANLYKGMQMPAEMLKGQEAAMLMQDPTYLQQKTQNTFIELQNKHTADQFQQTLNEVGRAKLALQASGGDPKALYPYLEKLGAQPGDPLYQAVDKNPEAVLTKYEQALTQMIANTGGAKQLGRMAEQNAQDAAAMERLKLQLASQERQANIRASSGGDGNLSTDKEYNRQLKLALAGDENAKRWVNTYIRNKQITNLQYGAPAFQFGQNGGGQMTTKGATAELPFPEVDNVPPKPVTVEAGGKVYSFPNQAAADSFKQRAGIK